MSTNWFEYLEMTERRALLGGERTVVVVAVNREGKDENGNGKLGYGLAMTSEISMITRSETAYSLYLRRGR